MPTAPLLLALALFLSSCAGPKPLPPQPAPPPPPAPAAPEGPVTRVPIEEWPLFEDDLTPASLGKAAGNSVAYLKTLGERLFQVGDISVGTQLLIDSAQALARIRLESQGAQELNARLREEFDLYRVAPSTSSKPMHFSGYFMPTLPASDVPTERFKYPIYAKPKDLVEVDLEEFNPKFRGETLIGRVTPKGQFAPYFNRRDIDVRKLLEGRDLELAWLENAFDRLDLHIQGSGILQFTDGKIALAHYTATNGLPYKSVGLSVVGAGAMTREEINRERLKRYLAEHPEGESWLISQNPRYVFFGVSPLPPDGEPDGKIKQPLTAGRSVAIDPKLIPLGASAFMTLPLPQADPNGKILAKTPASRFVFCQDVGGAILGNRVDVYIGHGPQARAVAANIWDAGQLYLLLKKLPAKSLEP